MRRFLHAERIDLRPRGGRRWPIKTPRPVALSALVRPERRS